MLLVENDRRTDDQFNPPNLTFSLYHKGLKRISGRPALACDERRDPGYGRAFFRA
ncbi:MULTISPECIES: hypothetical protein [unclassified Caulobacter]|uniref:hypothetical protein n=1 Tax=unclassified Caulobacter TaxID=2648921 RepID=UPI0013049784|nr:MULTISPECIES: hypothetical protein [unclassified Caulobacter]